jgi:hypothetical protein
MADGDERGRALRLADVLDHELKARHVSQRSPAEFFREPRRFPLQRLVREMGPHAGANVVLTRVSTLDEDFHWARTEYPVSLPAQAGRRTLKHALRVAPQDSSRPNRFLPLFIPRSKKLFRVTKGETSQWPVILLIENDEDDVFLFRRALGIAALGVYIRVMRSLTMGRAYLLNEFPYQDRAYYRAPQLVVTDYRLVEETLAEFAKWFRAQRRFDAIPLVVLSGATESIPDHVLKAVQPAALIQKTSDPKVLLHHFQPILDKLLQSAE